MKTVGAYVLIETKDGYFYIGSSDNIRKRITQHYSDLVKNRHHNSKLQELAVAGAYFREVIYPTDTREDAYLLEQTLLNTHMDNPLLLNIGLGVRGGDNLTRNPNKTAIINRIKTSVINRMCGMTPDERRILFGLSGTLNGMYGRTHTAEARQKQGERSKGNKYCLGLKRSKAQRELLSLYASQRVGEKNPFYGRHHTDKTRRVLSLAAIARNFIPPNKRRVGIEGRTYSSLTEASQAIGITPPLLVYRLKSKLYKYSGYKYIE